MSAFSVESLGAFDKAIVSFEKLLSITHNNFHAYKVAVLYFELSKFEEAYTAIKKAGTLTDTGEVEITFPINKNYNQPVPLKAAIIYLQGLVEQNLDNKTAAKSSFQKAMQVFPEFILAKDALSNLEVKPTE
jgi:tetratricopeptide (TPR) repeat protein